MNNLKNIAIIGAGAVGAYLAWGFANVSDVNVTLVADGARKEKLETEGLFINGEKYLPRVAAACETKDADVVFVSVKYGALRAALDDIEAVCGPDTIVLSLMNGIDSEDIIAERIGDVHVVPALIKIASERNGNEIRFNADATIGVIYGERDKSLDSPRMVALGELFGKSRLHYHAVSDIMRQIWLKFDLNVSSNQPQAILSVGVGAYRTSENVAYISAMLHREVVEIAKAFGVDIADNVQYNTAGAVVADRARYSMLQDLDAGRHTEVEMLAGTVVRLGKKYGIPTPCNEFAYHAIKALEEKNDGRFDYE